MLSVPNWRPQLYLQMIDVGMECALLKTLAFRSFQISQDDNISNGTIPFSPPPMHLGDHRKPTTP
jgi:hypothetical protein